MQCQFLRTSVFWKWTFDSSRQVNRGEETPYSTYMAGVVETEVDVLTGEFQVKRVDMMADFGERWVVNGFVVQLGSSQH